MAHLSNREKNSYLKFIKIIKFAIILSLLAGGLLFIGKSSLKLSGNKLRKIALRILPNIYTSPPLVMKGGDPHIRALMRTISASEANFVNPYHVIYGGKYVGNLSQHPNICMTIVRGPNKGKCTTAAGRYQFLNTTWLEKASEYHPQPSGFLSWQQYSFEPEYQDVVVYNWLSDSQAWDEDISQLLQEQKLERVLQLLSPTWTSLGYGIEDNSMTEYLPKIYHKMLQEETGDRIQNRY